MNDMKFERPKKRKEGTGFYLALIGCLAAIVAVTWTAVGSSDALTPENTGTVSESASDAEEVGAVPNRYIDGFDWEEDAEEEYSSVMQELADSAEPEKSPPEAEKKEKQVNATPVSAASAGEAVSAVPGDTASDTAKKNKQTYMLPVGNEVFKEYSGEELVYSMTFGDWRIHEGVDFKADKDQMVRCVGDGTVTDIVKNPLYGTIVIIDHGDFEAHYCGLVENVIVEKKQEVLMGDDLGNVGDIPCEIVEELHLHFGVKKAGKWVDPMAAMRRQ